MFGMIGARMTLDTNQENVRRNGGPLQGLPLPSLAEQLFKWQRIEGMFRFPLMAMDV